MKGLAQGICDIIHDYHAGRANFDNKHVIKWVSQFDEGDQKFILEEFLHLLKQNIYISEKKAKSILIEHIDSLAKHFKFKDTISFLKNVEFMRVQDKYKSQTVLLSILDKELINKYDFAVKDCGSVSKKYVVYLDDVLATGGTIFEDCKDWLDTQNEDGEKNFDKIAKKEKIFILSLLCKHTWGADNIQWRLKYHFGDDRILDKIKFQSHYKIENHPSKPEQKLNFIYPVVDDQTQMVLEYFNNLDATYKGEFAFRKSNSPNNETFFSSPKSRKRFENILLNKGVELLNMPRKFLQRNHRPLGVSSPSNKLLGTGTMFFTWRNVSNTTPIVFWWKLEWYPLFELDNRGIH